MENTKEKHNVCGLPKIADIEIRQSKETGKYYLNWIAWVDDLPIGLWTTQPLPKSKVDKILGMLKRRK